ncbi:hypothetical protein GTQ40_17930 [Flavobacteriaceae bacterium R38]|nr:hypothetical protein [Flavobacteriaceae bacterium R38]
MKKSLLLFVIFNICIISNAQKKSENTFIEEANTTYFELDREDIYLHLNKSTYTVGENIWFKGYIYNRHKEIPFIETSNVYVGIYDSLGKQLDKKLYKAKDGYTKGNIYVDSTFVSGDYYLKASTNWMKNFDQDGAFVQKIHVINSKTSNTTNTETKYDLQLLPEGGHLIENIQNTIGFKIIDQNGHGTPIKKGVLLDGDNNELISFKSNLFGIGKFSFKPQKGQSYKVRISFINNQDIETNLPVTEDKGIALSINNLSPQRVIISLKTNAGTVTDIADKKFKLLIHKDGKSVVSSVSFSNEKKETLISLKKENLFKGINTVTLFDENNTPLLERLFFNNFSIEYPDVTVAVDNLTSDSLVVKLSVLDKNPSIKNLSVSVLPEKTQSYNHKQNISSNFLLKPYIKGYIENPGYYFKNVNREKLYDLDLLLLTQGWSKYNWKEIIDNPLKKIFEFENGITLKGRFNQPNLDRFPFFSISPSKNHPLKILNLEQPDFVIPNLFPETDEIIGIAVVKKKGRFVKPKANAKFITNNDVDNVTPFTSSLKIEDDSTKEFNNIIGDVINLDEVTISEKAGEKKVYKFGVKELEITKEIADGIYLVTDYLETQGFLIDQANVIRNTAQRTLSLITDPQITVFFDNIPLVDHSFLQGMRMDEIEKIVINKRGIGEGIYGFAGTIRITSRSKALTSAYPKRSKSDNSNSFFVINTGQTFTPTKEFYAPKYITYFDKIFEQYGVIHWAPEVIIDQNGETTFKILNTGLKNLSFFIEGMDNNGNLISAKKTINLN